MVEYSDPRSGTKRWENGRGLMSTRLGAIAVIVVAVLELVG